MNYRLLSRYVIVTLTLVALLVDHANAQTVASPKTYAYLIYHKLAPGLTLQDALPVEREWRTINQAAVDEGNLVGWYMMAKQMTSNSNPTEYDYVTVIVSREMSLKGASPAAMTKIYGDSVKTRMADLQKRDRTTAPVVKMEIWESIESVFGPGFAPDKTPLMVVDLMQPRDSATDWMALTGSMKQVNTGRVNRNALMSWGFASLVVPKGSEKGYSLATFQNVPNLAALAGLGQAEAAGMSPAEFSKFQNQMNRTFNVVRQEVFRFTEYTIRPGASAQLSK